MDRAKRLLADPQSQVKLVAQQVGFENVNTFIRVFKEPLNKSPTADDGSFPPILRFEKREIHAAFLRLSNIVLTKNLSPSTAADLIRASLNIIASNYTALLRISIKVKREEVIYAAKRHHTFSRFVLTYYLKIRAGEILRRGFVV